MQAGGRCSREREGKRERKKERGRHEGEKDRVLREG